MKKYILMLLQVVFLLQITAFAACPLGQAHVAVSSVIVDNNGGIVTINGSVSTGEGKRITVTIYNSANELCDIWQGISGIDGEFTFVHDLKMGDAGEYTYKIKTTNIDTIKQGTFQVDLSQTLPSISELKLNGTPHIRQTINAAYKYIHMGGILEGASDIVWLVSDTVDGTYQPIANEKGKSLILLDTFAYKYIKIQVTPKTQGDVIGNMMESLPIHIISPPFALNVTTRGDFKVGETVYGGYDYLQVLMNYEEFGSEYKWIRFSNLSDTNGVQVGTNANYILTKEDLGLYICFEVTPKMKESPYIGDAVRSTKVLVAGSTSTSIATGGNSGTGSGSTVKVGGSSLGQITPNIPTVPTEDDFLPFLDTKSHWAKVDIEYMSDKNIVKGVSEKEFAPERTVTRAEFLAMLVRLLNLESAIYVNSFEDVNKDSWYSDIIQTAMNNGLASGDGATFRPNDNITRQEMCVMAVKALKIKGAKLGQSSKVNQYSDYKEISQWATEYITIAGENKIIKGYEDNTFKPLSSASRAEAAVVARRILDK